MSILRYEPEFQEAFGSLITTRNSNFTTIDELKPFVHRNVEAFLLSYESPTAGIETVTIPVTSFDGASINVYQTVPSRTHNETSPQSAVLYIHSGGHCAGSGKSATHLTTRYARATGISFFSVEYRLAPDYPAPYGVEDVLAAFMHVAEHAHDFNINPHKIIVMGHSSGGGLAAGLCLLARDRKLAFRPARQFLLEPMLDDRTVIAPNDSMSKLFTWTPTMNKIAWEAVLGADKAGKEDADVSIYVSPARASDLSDLPPAYIDIGALDLFIGETLTYAQCLFRAGIEVEMHVWPALPHMHDFYGLSTTTRTMGTRVSALRKI
ncbi:hypothetical protein Cpir12675_001402 [Ceratocystis pirilliformis]|uniref:Alpha/beta hydrolase fold-3 domain-containing protein n=1 Tax=Ceratocystis pirilliformis TaxID=259994 RepID=A0ABR3ZJB4_9PEZI